MNRISEDLYPMRVSPNNFSKGDAVKKIITDTIQTPYVGVVTRPIPSTNKVEVQWPYGMGIEDPWDLIKVNPVLDPPVVNEDKSYKTYQNTTSVKDHLNNLKHYNVLEDFISEYIQPVLIFTSALYNDGYSKSEAYKKMSSKFDSKEIVHNVISKVYSERFNLKHAKDIYSDGEYRFAEVSLKGDCDHGFKVSYSIDGDLREYYFKNPIAAVENYLSYKKIINAQDFDIDYRNIVSNVLTKIKEQEEGEL